MSFYTMDLLTTRALGVGGWRRLIFEKKNKTTSVFRLPFHRYALPCSLPCLARHAILPNEKAKEHVTKKNV